MTRMEILFQLHKELKTNMLKFKLSILAFFVSFTISASHILGGMLTVSQTSFDSTAVGLYLVSDAGFYNMSQNATVQQWERDSQGNWSLTNYVTVTKVAGLPHQGSNVYTYSSDYLDLDSGEYRFVYETCCWQPLNNSPYSYNSDIVISADYLHIPNNSLAYMEMPLWINMQKDSVNVLRPMFGIFNCFFTEPDGDSVDLIQTQLYQDHFNGVFSVQPSQSPSNMWVHTDSMTFVSSTLGLVGNGFEIKEYRNGQLLGTQRIQWPFRVVSSTLDIQEYQAEKEILGIWDWSGREVKYQESGKLYLIRYTDGSYSKVLKQ